MRLILMFLLLTGPANAAGRTWTNDECSVAVISENDAFTYIPDTGKVGQTVCTIYDWPVSNPVAVLKCADGTMPKMELIGDDQLKFDGHLLTVDPTNMNEGCD